MNILISHQNPYPIRAHSAAFVVPTGKKVTCYGASNRYRSPDCQCDRCGEDASGEQLGSWGHGGGHLHSVVSAHIRTENLTPTKEDDQEQTIPHIYHCHQRHCHRCHHHRPGRLAPQFSCLSQ